MITDRHSGGSGCPETNGGPHFYVWLYPYGKTRTCLDCGAKEEK
jgi:hypothetical protein